MALWTQLGQLRTMLRHELGLAASTAVSPDINDPLDQAINFAVEQIGDEFGWPHIKARHTITLQPDERYYGMPATLDHDAIDRVWVEWQTIPHDVHRGIGADQFASFKQGEQHDPVERFEIINDLTDVGEGTVLEVWPVPLTSYPLYLVGLRKYDKLVDDADTCPFDDQAVVFWAASLRSKTQEEQNRLMTLARGRLQTKRSNASSARPVAIIGESEDKDSWVRRPRMIVVQ